MKKQINDKKTSARHLLLQSGRKLCLPIYKNKHTTKIENEKDVIATLSQLYYFHCYNLARTELLSDTDEIRLSTQMRTTMVHGLFRMKLDPSCLTKTQLNMSYSLQRDIRYLFGDTLAANLENRFEDLPLFKVIMSEKKMKGPNFRYFNHFPVYELVAWIKEDIIPQINSISSSLDKEDQRKAATLVMIMILGEYCLGKKIKAAESIEADKDVIKTMQTAKRFRNIIAHETNGLSDEDLSFFLESIKKVNPSVKPANTLEGLMVNPHVSLDIGMFSRKSQFRNTNKHAHVVNEHTNKQSFNMLSNS